MKIILKNKRRFITRLDSGEDLIKELERLTRREQIKAAWIFGLGSARQTELAYFNLEKKEYFSENFDENLEVVNLTGNISWMDNAPLIHIHGVLGNKKFQSFVGHIKKLIVSATLELRIDVFTGRLTKKKDEIIGLNLLN